MAAFANSGGGTIFLGVADDGTLLGLDKEYVARLNQLSFNVAVGKSHVVIALTIPNDPDKPVFRHE